MSMADQKKQTNTANPLKRPRQEPVSCQFCRSKKLKCSRQYPCSNCAARGLPCDGQPQPSQNLSPPGDTQNDSILARLKRLEEIVLGSPQHGSSGAYQGSHPSPSLTQSRPTTSPVPGISPASEYEETVQSLEKMGARQDPWFRSNFIGPEFQVSPMHQICSAHSMAQTQTVYGQPASKRVFLPPKEEASLLMSHYISYIDPLQHVVYIPHIRALMDSVYLHMEQGVPVVHSHVALVLSIFANSAALISGNVGGLQHLFQGSDPYQAAIIWANAALEVLEFSRRTASSSLEDIQASILTGFLLYHMEGYTARSRYLFVGTIATARDLCLHKIDAPTNPPSPYSNSLDTELKRRVWWHVVATDWLLAHNGGPQEGTYLLQPRQMRVNMPRNVDDKDLIHDNPPINLPLSEPTTMSYYIQRIKLADICRSVVDVMPLSSLQVSTIDYLDVIALDRKFETFFEELPTFLKTDEQSRSVSESIMRRYPHMRVQRYSLGTIALIRRCKLHQPFLIRRPAKGNYTYSRNISLQCAREVLRMKRLVDAEHGTILHATVKPGVITYHVFMATIVLVMDLCFNRNESDDTARKAEVEAACKTLEDSISQSRCHASYEFLNSLTDTLRKHKVKLRNLPSGTFQRPPAQDSMAMYQPPKNVVPIAKQVSEQLQNPWLQDNTQNVLSDFDEIWKEYIEYGPNMDMPDWDGLFNDLDSRLC